MPMPCTASTLGFSHSLIIAAMAFYYVADSRSARPQTSATRVLPGRAGAGMERAEKKVGDLAGGNRGEGCMQTTDLSLSM